MAVKSNLQKRMAQLENDSAVRIALAEEGLLDANELTEEETQMVIDATPPELHTLFEQLTPEQCALLETKPFEELPDELRAIWEEIIYWDRHYFGQSSELE